MCGHVQASVHRSIASDVSITRHPSTRRQPNDDDCRSFEWTKEEQRNTSTRSENRSRSQSRSIFIYSSFCLCDLSVSIRDLCHSVDSWFVYLVDPIRDLFLASLAQFRLEPISLSVHSDQVSTRLSQSLSIIIDLLHWQAFHQSLLIFLRPLTDNSLIIAITTNRTWTNIDRRLIYH